MEADLPDNRHEEASRQVEELLQNFSDVRALTKGELASYGNRFVRGWEVPGICTVSDLNLRLLLDKNFPFHPPRVAVSPAPPVLAWPNLEKGGLLCLLSESARVSISEPAAVVLSLLDDAKGLVKANLAGDHQERFEEEFQNYWIRWKNTNASMRVLCRPEGPSRWVSAWHGKHFTLSADDAVILKNWFRNQYGEEAAKKAELQPVPLVWLPRPPHPSEYPQDVSALMKLLRRFSIDRTMVEQLLLDEQASFKSVVLGFNGQHGAGFAGLRIQKPKQQRRSGDPLTKGFRGRPPDDVLLVRYGAGPIVGASATRYDPSWVHGRDQNDDVGTLVGKSAIVIGCGSLGSTVVELIAKAGVGTIRFVDHDLMESENAGRHALGVSSVGLKKASEIGRSLASRYPHLTINSHPESFECFIEDNLDQLKSADLIISATGNWHVEGLLNAIFCDSREFPPVMYSWLEPHATAGHATVFFKEQGCFCCLVDDLGDMYLPAAEWKSKATVVPVPACGGLFQPYGAVELTHVHALVADLALDVLLGHVKDSTHRVWLAPKKLLDRTGGMWNPAWIEHHGDPGVGGVLRDITVENHPNCRGCGVLM